jgi:hypothetical protein
MTPVDEHLRRFGRALPDAFPIHRGRSREHRPVRRPLVRDDSEGFGFIGTEEVEP